MGHLFTSAFVGYTYPVPVFIYEGIARALEYTDDRNLITSDVAFTKSLILIKGIKNFQQLVNDTNDYIIYPLGHAFVSYCNRTELIKYCASNKMMY
ncbi:MAG: hypothetical protein RCG15_04210 [Candidatus Rickettsia vulgarisii]